MAKTVNADEVPENEEFATIGDDWAQPDLPFIQIDSLLGVPMAVYGASIGPSTFPGAQPGSRWATFDAVLLKAPKHGELALKDGTEVDGFDVGSRISSSTGARGCCSVIDHMTRVGFAKPFVVMIQKVVTPKSDKGRTFQPLNPAEYAAELEVVKAVLASVEDDGE